MQGAELILGALETLHLEINWKGEQSASSLMESRVRQDLERKSHGEEMPRHQVIHASVVKGA